MKRIWARIGMSLEVTDKEFSILKGLAAELAESRGYDGDEEYYADLELADGMVQKFMKRGTPDGESYIPAAIFEEIRTEE